MADSRKGDSAASACRARQAYWTSFPRAVDSPATLNQYRPPISPVSVVLVVFEATPPVDVVVPSHLLTENEVSLLDQSVQVMVTAVPKVGVTTRLVGGVGGPTAVALAFGEYVGESP